MSPRCGPGSPECCSVAPCHSGWALGSAPRSAPGRPRDALGPPRGAPGRPWAEQGSPLGHLVSVPGRPGCPMAARCGAGVAPGRPGRRRGGPGISLGGPGAPAGHSRPGHTCKHENDKRRLHFYNHPVKQIKSLPVAGLKFVPRRELVLENASLPFFMGCFFVEPRLSARAVAARAANVFVAARRTS